LLRDFSSPGQAIRVEGPDGVVRVHVDFNHPDFVRRQAWLKSMGPGNLKLEIVGLDSTGRPSRIATEKRFFESPFEQAAREIKLSHAIIASPNQPCYDALKSLDDRLKAELASAPHTPAAAAMLEDHRSHALILAQYAALHIPKGDLLVCRLDNPWISHEGRQLLPDPMRFVDEKAPARHAVERTTGSRMVSSTFPATKFPYSLTVMMPGNAYASEAISVTNMKAETVHLKIEPAALGVSIPSIVVRDCPRIVPASNGIPREDPLPLISDLTLRPGESHKLWLTFSSRTLDAGKHNFALQFTDAEHNVDFSEPIVMNVLPISIPANHVFRHVNWLYLAGIGDPALFDKTLDDALEHDTNVFNVPQCTVHVDADGSIVSADTEPHDRIVKRLCGVAEMLIDGSIGVAWPNGVHPTPEQSEKAYAGAIRWYADHMRELGCAYSDYALYLADEPGITGADSRFLNFARGIHRVKLADPHMRIFCNPAGGANADVLAPIVKDVDIWCPDLHLVKANPPALQAIFHQGGEYWHYEAPGDQRSIDPLGFYRMQPWVAYRYGMTGGGYWVYSQTTGFAADPGREGEYGAVYPTKAGPIPSKRWEATREGIQDYELLCMLRDATRNMPAAQAIHAMKLIAHAVADITKGQELVTDVTMQANPLPVDYDMWMKYRREIVDALLAARDQAK